MNNDYGGVVAAWEELKANRCVQTGNAMGGHYLLAMALILAGVSTRGLTKEELEGEALRIVGLAEAQKGKRE